MHRIDSPSAGPGNSWVASDAEMGTPATAGTAKYFQNTQEELCNVVEGAGIALDDEDDTQLLSAIPIIAGSPPLLRNLAINGDFRFWQRRAEPSPARSGVDENPVYVADRWYVQADTGIATGVATVSRQAFPIGHTQVPGSPRHYLRVQWTTGTQASQEIPLLRQFLEHPELYSGREITISAYLRYNGSGSSTAFALCQVSFGSGGSASSPVGASPGSVEWASVGTSFERRTATFTIPDLTGKTLDPAETGDLNAYIEFQIGVNISQGIGDQWDVADVQIELGSSATQFQRRPESTELALCRRYFEKSHPIEAQPGGGAEPRGATRVFYDPNGTVNEPLDTRFLVAKRATVPKVYWYNPADGDVDEILRGASQAKAVTANSDASDVSTGYPTTTGGETSAEIYQAHYTADAELYPGGISSDAE